VNVAGAEIELPIVGAPLAGGPSTPALAAAVSAGGGLGFVAAGYRTAAEVAADVESVRRTTEKPFGVNLFVPGRRAVDEAAVAAYARRLAGEEARYGVASGEPRWSDDDWIAKLELVERERPAVVSFTFGLPDAGVVQSLQAAGITVWCTITSPAEAAAASKRASRRSSSRVPRPAATRARGTTPTMLRSRCFHSSGSSPR
jgi:nitronate monooxygenase